MASIRLLALLFLLLVTGSPASALSIAQPLPGGCNGFYDDWRVSSFDLVLRADAIVVAVAGTPAADSVPLRLSRTLKGRTPDRFTLPLGFVSGGPGGRAGEDACQTWAPRKDQTYLFFLVRDGSGHLQALYGPSGSVASRYEGAQQGWEPLVRLYLGIQEKQPPETWRPTVEALLRTRMRPDADGEEQWQARQLADYLRTLSRTTPTVDLLALLNEVRQGRLPPWGAPMLQRFDNRPWPEFITDIRPRSEQPPLQWVERDILIALQTGWHPAAADLFRAMGEHPADVGDLGNAIGYFARNGQRSLALDLLQRHFIMVARLPVSDRCGFAEGVGVDMAGQRGGDRTTEAWRSDPIVVERWPALAFDLLRLNGGVCSDWLDSAFIRAAADYREPLSSRNRYDPLREANGNYQEPPSSRDWQDLLLLANAGSRAALDWAEAAIDRFLTRKTVTWVGEQQREDAVLAFQMLVRRNDPTLLMRVAERGYCHTDGRAMLLAALAAHGTNLSVPARLLASWNPQTEPGQRSALMTMLVRIYGRRPAGVGPYYGPSGDGSTSPFTLLEDLVAGRPGPGQPFLCPPAGKAGKKP